MFLTALPRRLLPLVGWVVSFFLLVLCGQAIWAGYGYLFIAFWHVIFSIEVLEGLNFLVFPWTGGFIGFVALHIIRVFCWMKLHNRYMKEHEEWKKKYTVWIAIFDEIMWLITTGIVCVILVTCL